MRTAKDLISFAGFVGDTINFNAHNFRILGSSIPTLMKKGKGYGHVSITLPKGKRRALVFFMTSKDNVTAFLKFCRKESGHAWANLDEELVPPCEMVVSGDTITVKTNTGDVVSTDNKPGAYKVTHDAMCQFLIGDISEEELLASATKLAEEESEFERLRDLISHYEEMERASSMDLSAIKTQLDDLCKIKDSYGEKLLEVRQVSMEPWRSIFTRGSRLSRIRKML